MLPVNGLAKESWKKGTKKISRCARNDSVGNGYPLYRIKCSLGKCSSCITISRYARNDRVENEYPVHHTKNVWETRSSCIVIPSEVEGSFWHTGIASYVRQRKRGNLLRKEQERAECKEDFLTALEMTVWGKGFISRSVQRICLESAIPVSSSRAEPRDLSGTPV